MADTLQAALETSFLRWHASLEKATDKRFADVAQQWVAHLHAAFYDPKATRGGNRFLEIEGSLRDVCQRLSCSVSHEFWSFVVHVVLLLAAPELTPVVNTVAAVAVESPDASEAKRSGNKKSKKKAKSSQPKTPLAFLVVNALGKVSIANEAHSTACHDQGRLNVNLQAFCTNGLAHVEAVVRPCNPLAVG